MKVMKTSDVRQNLQEVLDTVYYKEESVIVTKSNKARVMISPLPKDDAKVEAAINAHLNTSNKIK